MSSSRSPVSPQHYATARLEAERFAAVVESLAARVTRGRRLSDDAVRIARLVLVDGRRQGDVARENDKHRQQVHNWIRAIVDEHNKLLKAEAGDD